MVPRTGEELFATLVEAFVSTLRETPVTFPVELLWIFLLVEIGTDLREFSLPRFTVEPEIVLLDTLVAEVLSTPERLLSIDLLFVAWELFILRLSMEALSLVLVLFPEFLLA